jgi:hypothetical protein
VPAGLEVAGLVEDEHRVALTERLDHVPAQVITHRVGVPRRTREQMLQRVRPLVAAMLADRPAVLAVQRRQHPQHQPACVTQRLVPGKPRRDAVNHRAVRRPPSIRIYAMSRGHRGDLFVPHKQGMLARWPCCARPKRPSRASRATQITIYHCRTRRSRPGFRGPWSRRRPGAPRIRYGTIEGGIGHNLPQEAPRPSPRPLSTSTASHRDAVGGARGSSGAKRDSDELAALRSTVRVRSAARAEVVDVGYERFGDPQPVDFQ